MTERTLLLTGFGPFPGVPVNPSEAVLRRIAAGPLARRLGIRIVTHRFDTTFAALDGLPRLVADFRPDACLHLGIAANSRFLRVETRGTNFGAPFLPDAAGAKLAMPALEAGAPAFRAATVPVRRIRDRIAATGLPARLSPSAGRYLCNIVLWRSLQLARADGTRRPVGFLHLPPTTATEVARRHRPGRARPVFTTMDLVRATEQAIAVIAGALPPRRG